MNRRRLKVNLSFTLPPGAYATLVVRRVLWFAAESRRSEENVGRAGAAASENAPPKRAAEAVVEEAPAVAAVEKPATPKMGFRERQKRDRDAGGEPCGARCEDAAQGREAVITASSTATSPSPSPSNVDDRSARPAMNAKT